MSTATTTASPAQRSAATRNFVRAKATLAGHRCTHCNGTLELYQITEFSADNGRLIVPLAYVNVCDGCGREYVTEEEWQRWHAD